ncbi:hypothetical protein SAMN04488168_11957 [Bacillus sp. 491mf]|uniref:hypothetical protein n=1 Tax=Bacillus TaxID=1386 RepID=UPI000557A274|nr:MULTISPECIES: hypothetical protein [unclassified Bacillus (in: firmicutes)]SFD12697.1 hypothetical protein SAMN04488168_11957 [Bacillus sp. 491mf]
MLHKIKFYVIGCLASVIIGAIMTGFNILFGTIYRIIKGKELHVNMTSALIIFSIVSIIGFVSILKKGPSILEK